MQLFDKSWQASAKAKVADIHSRIPNEWVLSATDLEKAKQQRSLTGDFIEQFLDDGEKNIIRTGSVGLVEKLKCRVYTAVDVARAFCHTAAVAQQIISGPIKNNCLHEIMFDFAMQTARELDQFYAENGKPKGPLHGLPVSLKDQFHVKGYDTTMGYVGWIGTYEGIRDPTKRHQVDSQIVKELLSLGAVLFCKAKLLFKLFEGVRLGSVPILNPGQDTYASSIGVMGTTIDAVKLVLKSLLSTSPWLRDPNVVKMPWDSEVETSTLGRANSDGSATHEPLKIGIYWTDDVVTPHPPVQRGLRLVRNLLQGLEHKVVDWSPPSHTTAKNIHLGFLRADGAHDINQQLDLSGEPLVPPLRGAFQLRDPTPLLEYQRLTVDGKAYNEAYYDYWNSTTKDDGQVVDAVLMPVAPHAAVIPGKFFHTAYTESINLMDFSAVVIPVTTADKLADAIDDTYQPLNEVDRMNWEAYDPETYHGAPVGLQLVARKWEEEKVWAIAKIIDTALKNRR
ncbi:MAG: hypothetical protein Q9170_002890 [Blastenia crenularia]